MKMKKIFISISLVACLGIVIFSCKKTQGVNPLADVANLGHGAYITLDTAINLNFNFADLANSTVSIKVTQYPNGNDIDKINVFVVKGSNADPAVWKMVKTVPYSGQGTALTVSGAELAAGLGVDLSSFQAGDYYTFYNQVITKSGETYDISNTYSALESGSYYNVSFRWTTYITCPFTGGMTGNYTVIQDDWADWSPGDVVQVSDGPGPNEIDLSAVWPNPAYGNLVDPLVVDIDPATGVAKVHKVNFGDYGGGYNMTAVGTGAGDVAGYVFSCTGYISLQMSLIANATGGNGYNNGTTNLILQKQ
jgi:hypothetical protein